MGVGQGAGILGFFSVSFPQVQIVSCAEVRTFLGVWSFSVSLASYVKFVSLAKSAEFVSSRKPMGPAIAAWGVAMQLVIRQ